MAKKILGISIIREDSVKLTNESLRDVDPFDPALDEATKKAILQECQVNIAYFTWILKKGQAIKGE